MRRFYQNTIPNHEKICPVARPLPPEEKFSYFCKFDELPGSMICPDVPLLSIKESCYQKISDIFDEE